ncbi:MAG: TolC family protein [Paludibacteraceae bacterium]|nr:TolC family protein [Paludibacteraceae bacterium]
MKKIIYLLLFTALSSNMVAQTDTLTLSLDQAMQLGLNNRFDSKESSLNIDVAKSKKIKSKKELLPDISANGKVIYNGQVQPTIVPAGYLGFTSPEKIALGMKNNTAFALDLNYSIYKPGLYTDIKIAANNIVLETEKNHHTNIDIKTEIAEAYENVLLKAIQYDIALKNEARYNEYYELALGEYNNGALIESDRMLAKLDYKNAKTNTEKLKQNYLLSVQYLKYKLAIPDQTAIKLTETIESAYAETTTETNYTNPTTDRTEIKQLWIEQRGIKLQLSKARQNYLPSFDVTANYTKLFQGAGFDYANSFYWTPVDYVGLRLSVPITGSIKNANTVKEYKIQLRQNALKLQQKTADVQYEILEALTQLNNAKQNLRVAKDNYDLSGKVYNLKKQQYNSGSFPYQQLLDTEKSLTNADQEYITSIYNFLLAKINYQKAIGMY